MLESAEPAFLTSSDAKGSEQTRSPERPFVERQTTSFPGANSANAFNAASQLSQGSASAGPFFIAFRHPVPSIAILILFVRHASCLIGDNFQ